MVTTRYSQRAGFTRDPIGWFTTLGDPKGRIGPCLWHGFAKTDARFTQSLSRGLLIREGLTPNISGKDRERPFQNQCVRVFANPACKAGPEHAFGVQRAVNRPNICVIRSYLPARQVKTNAEKIL
jgi:hypothetical protein